MLTDVVDWLHATELISRLGEAAPAAVISQFERTRVEQDYRSARRWLKVAEMVEALTWDGEQRSMN